MLRPTVLKLSLQPHEPHENEIHHQENFRMKWFYNNQGVSFVSYNSEQMKWLNEAMEEIKSSLTGRQLLQRIDAALRSKQLKLSIHLSTQDTGVKAHKDRYAGNYLGTGSDFYCNLRQNSQMREDERKKENACIVFHELLHVLHNLEGKRLMNSELNQGFHPLLLEEAKTVGLGKYSAGNLSENAFRYEKGYPRRTFYQHYNDITVNDDDTVRKGPGNHISKFPPLYFKK
ncbi:M91 family zinc metallopeptidase [Xenorhabdus sp. BG5]|uniref:M91 family zinc metallopeptidase n=1 Tax=Xenorhabdus sp. BG5 TaxID=2782014 RepID=UPI0018818259|nr:M91 family zinc metallopeptidase [Xenorhabdus sp. BG5]MBE8595072.1 T3SS effector protein NleD [Xenorhabdus sp. BG5]